MGKQIHLEKVERLFEKSPVVDFKSIERIIGKNNYAKLLISNLLKKNKIKKVGKGVYTKYDEISLSVFAFKPAYLGLQSALSFYGLWEQETIPVILTTKKVRRGIREFLGTNVLIRNINKTYFFGFELLKEDSFYLPYSDIEKTFIDMVVFNQPIDKQLLKEIKKKINLKKLETYLKRYPEKIRIRVKKLFNLL
jgi:predicted transcriptional regulator of viral defense system